MPQSFVSRMVLLVAGFLVVTSLWESSLQAEVLQAGADLKWFRGNLHTHSHWSDGDDYLEMIALWYREHSYQFLVFTDHNVLANTERWIDVEESKGGPSAYGKLKVKFPKHVQERITAKGKLEVRLQTFQEVANQFNDPGKFVLIQGEEISDRFEKLPVHLCAGNIVDVIPPMKGSSVYDTIQNNVRAVIVQREKTGQPMMVHVNHPNFEYAITAEDLMRVRGERFFEVYNGHPQVANSGDEQHASMDRIWDIILARRLSELHLPIMYGLAVDDGHDYHTTSQHKSNPGRGWVMVLAKQLTAKSLIDALEAGRFYASSGVTLLSVIATKDTLTVEIKPVDGETYVTEFIGTRRGYNAESKPITDSEGKEIHATRVYSTDIGENLKTVAGNRAEYQFEGDEIYIRARVTSSAGQQNPAESGDLKRAWVQPILGPAANASKD